MLCVLRVLPLRGYEDNGNEEYDEYPDDFEDYSPTDDQETINQKVQMLRQMENLELSGQEGFGVDDTAIAQVCVAWLTCCHCKQLSCHAVQGAVWLVFELV